MLENAFSTGSLIHEYEGFGLNRIIPFDALLYNKHLVNSLQIGSFLYYFLLVFCQ